MFGLSGIETLIFVIAALTVPASVFYLGLRWVRTAEGRASSHGDAADLKARVERMEDALADVTAQLERLAQGQEFTTHLLEGREPTGAPRAR